MRDFFAMMHFVVERGIRPVVSAVLPLERCAEAFALMERGGTWSRVGRESAFACSMAPIKGLNRNSIL